MGKTQGRILEQIGRINTKDSSAAQQWTNIIPGFKYADTESNQGRMETQG